MPKHEGPILRWLRPRLDPLYRIIHPVFQCLRRMAAHARPYTDHRLRMIAVLLVLATAWLIVMASITDSDLWRIAIPGILTATGTTSLAVATAIGISEEHNRLRSEAESRSLTEAMKVVATFPTGNRFNTIEVVNASNGPIMDVRISLAGVFYSAEYVDGENPIVQWQPLESPPPIWRILLSGERATFRGGWVDRQGTAGSIASSDMARNLIVTVYWTDASGRPWRRVGKDWPTGPVSNRDTDSFD